MIDKTKEQMKRTRKKIVEEAPLELLENEPLVLRIFIDRSIAEVFAHDKQAIVLIDEKSKKQRYFYRQGRGILSIYDRGYTNFTGNSSSTLTELFSV